MAIMAVTKYKDIIWYKYTLGALYFFCPIHISSWDQYINSSDEELSDQSFSSLGHSHFGFKSNDTDIWITKQTQVQAHTVALCYSPNE